MKPHIVIMLMITCFCSGASIAIAWATTHINKGTIEINRLHKENKRLDDACRKSSTTFSYRENKP